MKSAIKIALPLSLLLLAGCATSRPAPPPVHYEPYYTTPAHPRHKRPHKKVHRKQPRTAAHYPHQKAATRTAPGQPRTPEKKTRPERPVVLYSNDATLAQQVNAALNNDPALRGAHIQARASQGNIWLVGRVATDAQKDRAVAVAGNVTGVKMVNDQLKTAH